MEPHLLKAIADEQNAPVLAAYRAVRFRGKRKPVQGRITGRISEFIYRVTVFVDALDDTKRPLVKGRAEKARHGRIALILCRKGQRSEPELSNAQKTRVEKIQPRQLLPLRHL